MSLMGETVHRMTRQKAAVRGLLNDIDGFRSAQELHELLTERGERVGLATVYRNLQQLTESGEVDVVRIGDENLYRACQPQHHHHLVCRSCGYTVEFSGDYVENLAKELGAAYHFVDVSHTLELFGLCENCVKVRP